jgi:hypothetical protein
VFDFLLISTELLSISVCLVAISLLRIEMLCLEVSSDFLSMLKELLSTSISF